jgi:hypothetical protein
MGKINWKEYNEKLVKRGEVLFSTEFIEDWRRELEEMNERKRGHPYEYPNSYIQFLISIRYYCHLDYRRLLQESVKNSWNTYTGPLNDPQEVP